MIINDRIVSLIADLNTNPTAFAENIGVKSAVIYNIIKGRRNKPSYDVLNKILDFYTRISAQWLLKGQGNIWLTHESPITTDIGSRVESLLNRIDTQIDDNVVIGGIC